MLQTIHEKFKGVFAFVILGILSVVFVFWGVEFVSLGGVASSTGLTVNGEDVPAEQVRRVYLDQVNQLQAALGDQEIPADLRQRLQDDVLEGSIRRELIRQRAEQLRLRASNEDVLRSLTQIQAFQVDGRFSKDAYYAALRAENIEPVQFESQQREQIQIRMLDRGIAASAFVTLKELDRIAALRNESRTLAYAVLPSAAFLAEVNPDDAALEAWYAKNDQRFVTAETAALEYVELSLAELSGGVTVTEEALRGYYEQNRDRYAGVERRRASHILINLGDDEAKAKKQADDLYARAKAGEDFAALARQFSQDPGSASQGGDLGWAEKSFFVGPFADAVWALQPGEISAPVRTEFGFHVIRLEGVEPGKTRSYEEARAEIEAEYRRAEAEKLFGDLQEQLDTLAFEAGGDLAKVAARLQLPVRKVDAFTRNGGGGLGPEPRLVSTVFDAEVRGGTVVRAVELGEGRVVAVRVASYVPARPRPLAEVRAQVLEAVRLEQAGERASAAAAELMKQLQGGGDWAALAAGRSVETAGGPSATPRPLRRTDASVPPAVLKAAFKAPRPGAAPVYGLATLETGDVAVWTVTAAQPGSPQALADGERQAFAADVQDKIRLSDSTLYIGALRAGAEVETNPTVFQ